MTVSTADNHEWTAGKDLKIVFWYTPGETEENHKSSVRIDDNPVELRIWHSPKNLIIK
jgi:hypothetical protein